MATLRTATATAAQPPAPYSAGHAAKPTPPASVKYLPYRSVPFIPDQQGKPLLWLDEPALTLKQAQILLWIIMQPLPPTLREIASTFGFCRNSAAGHVCRLADKGYLKWEEYSGRTMRLLAGRKLRWREV